MSVVVDRAPRERDKAAMDWQVPAFTASPESRMQWVEEQIREGDGWLAGQAAYKNMADNLRVFEALTKDATKSTLITNSLKVNVRKFVETISDVREIASYSSDAPQFKSYAAIENKLARAIYLESDYPGQVRKAVQYACVFGRGYLWAKCKAEDYGWGERKLVFEPLGPLDVVPVQVPSSNDVQDAYAVTVYEYMPIAEAHGRFPLFQHALQPVDRTSLRSRIEARRLDAAERARYADSPARRNWGSLYTEVRYTYIRDNRINREGVEIPMGELGTSWFYKVPSVGQQIFGGVQGGSPVQRTATLEDCRIYPYKRLIITAKGMATPMYDGPAYDWHGRIPTVQIDVEDWAWEPMGHSLVHEVAAIQRTKRKLERKIDQVITATLNPPMGYDRGQTGGPKIENFDIFEENVRMGLDGEPTKVMQSLLPEEVRVNEVHFKMLEYLAEAEKQQLGMDDLTSLGNLKMNVTGDAAEKALESVGPVAKAIAANLEYANKKIGEMLKYMLVQWLDTKRVIEYIGADSLTPEVFDFDPASLVPSHMPDEHVDGVVPTTPSYYNQIDRSRRFAANLRLLSTPSTLLKITQQQEQLKYLQLSRGGFPISNATVAKKLDIANYGEVEGNTEREKWANEQKETLLLKAQLAQLAAQVMPQAPDGGDGPGKGGAHKGGRPPSGQKPGKIAQKGGQGGNPRTVVKES